MIEKDLNKLNLTLLTARTLARDRKEWQKLIKQITESSLKLRKQS